MTPPDGSAKPVDNATHTEIKALSDKFDTQIGTVHKRIDESSTGLREEIDKTFLESKKDRQTDKDEVAATLKSDRERNRWLVGILVVLVGWFLNSVDGKLDDVNKNLEKTNANLVALTDKTAGQDSKIDVMNEKLNRQVVMENLYQRLDKEVQGIRLEFEGLKTKTERPRPND